jgi:hypothetical protein
VSSVSRASSQDPASPGRGLSSARHDLGEGLRWVWRHPAIRDVTIMAAVVSAMDAAWSAVFVLYVMKVLHQQAGAYGLLLAIAAAAGIRAPMLIGAGPIAAVTILLAWRHRDAGRAPETGENGHRTS